MPLGETLEIWRVRLTNERTAPARLSLFGAVEFCLWDALDDATNFQRNYSIGEVEVEDGVDLPQDRVPRAPRPLRVLRLLGAAGRVRHAARRVPRAVPGLGPADRRRARGVLRLDRPRLAADRRPPRPRSSSGPGETRDVVFVLGYAENPADAEVRPAGLADRIDKRRVRPVIERYLRAGRGRRGASTGCAAHWSGLLGLAPGRDGQRARGPDGQRLEPLPVHGHLQPVALGLALRVRASAGASGFRDSNQDLLGLRPHGPGARPRSGSSTSAGTQLPSGGAYHQYQPLTKRGNDAVGSGFNDDPLWLVLAVAAYLKETGDATILDEPVPYDSQPGTETPLYEHLAAR